MLLPERLRRSDDAKDWEARGRKHREGLQPSEKATHRVIAFFVIRPCHELAMLVDTKGARRNAVFQELHRAAISVADFGGPLVPPWCGIGEAAQRKRDLAH